MGLTVSMALSAGTATAAHKIIETGSGTLELQSTPAAGGATGQLEYQITPEDGVAALTFTPRLEGLESPENIEIVLVDQEKDLAMGLGKPSEVGAAVQTRVPLTSLQESGLIAITRPIENGNEDSPPEILFTAELPHG